MTAPTPLSDKELAEWRAALERAMPWLAAVADEDQSEGRKPSRDLAATIKQADNLLNR